MDEKGKEKSFETLISRETKCQRTVTFRMDKQECLIIDVAIPGGQHVVMKEEVKVDKYRDLRTEITKMWQLREQNKKVIPIVFGALDSILPNRKKNQRQKTSGNLINTQQPRCIANIGITQNCIHIA